MCAQMLGVDWRTDGSIDQANDWLSYWLNAWMSELMNCSMSEWLVEWLRFTYLHDCLTDWSIEGSEVLVVSLVLVIVLGIVII